MPAWVILLLIPIASIGQGLNWPPTSISVLALGTQDKQAVISTTLGLLRYIGSILGIAISSWIFQNAFIMFLDQLVTDPSAAVKEQIILAVRETVSAIATLDPKHKEQVIQAYAQALRGTFAFSIIVALLVIFVTLPVKLPDLGRSSANSHREQADENVASSINDLEDPADNLA